MNPFSKLRDLGPVSVMLVFQLLLPVNEIPVLAQEAERGLAPPALNIVILEGDGAINNIRQRTAREPVVQVEDENHKPVGGAMVLFTLPDNGPGAAFANGSKTLLTYTDDRGQVKAKGLKPNNIVGAFQMLVTATSNGLKATAVIKQSNAMTVAGGGGMSAKLIAILAIAGGATAAGVVAAKSGGNNTPTPTPTPTATVTAGTPTVSAPN